MKIHKQYTRSLLLSSLLLASASVAGAAVMQYSGTFSVTFPNPAPSGQTYQGVPALTGSWSFYFDDSDVDPTTAQIYPVTLHTFTLTPNVINLTEFNLSNVGAQLFYIFGNLHQISIGGTVGGVSGVPHASDDFAVGYDGGTRLLQNVNVSSAAVSGAQWNSGTGSFNPETVPEPSSSLLAVTAVAGLLLRRSRRA